MWKQTLNLQINIDIIVWDHEEYVFATKSTTQQVISEPVIEKALVALNATQSNHDLELQRNCLKGDTLQIMNVVKLMSRI